MRRSPGRYLLLALPILTVILFLFVPLAFTVVISFWRRVGFRVTPDFTLASYTAFVEGARFQVLERSLWVAAEATAFSLVMAYPIAYALALRASARSARAVLMLFTIPFLVNYVIRAFSWSYLLSRTGPINQLLMATSLTGAPVDWLLFSDFAVLVGLVTSYMPFMIFPLWLSLSAIDRRLIHASWLLGARPAATFVRITLPLSLPGVFAAVIFGLVGSFGESAIPVILGGTGYELMGNAITSTLDILNYPLAAAMSTIVVLTMLLLLTVWFTSFDVAAFLGKLIAWKA
jgi:ABC-type spermidine/putrescine transport system permease subunit I